MTSETMQQELLHIIQRNSPDFLRRLLVNAVCLERAIQTEKAPGTAATMQGAKQKNKLHNHSTVDQAVCQVSRWGEL